MKLLKSVMRHESFPAKVAKAILEEHGGFSNIVAKQTLIDDTVDKDAETRVSSSTTWLKAALSTSSCSHIAESMVLFASRIKSEAEIHRHNAFMSLAASFPRLLFV